MRVLDVKAKDLPPIDLLIGAITENAGTTLHFKGIIDEISIYSRALSASEIQEHYAQFIRPVACWHMDEPFWNGTPDEVIDSSGYGNHGMAYNGANTTDCSISGRAGYFDGIDDYVNIPHSEDFWIDNGTSITKEYITKNSG